MVWGCFSGPYQGPLVSFHGINTVVTYVPALQENLLPFIETMPLYIKHDFIFQQDIVTIHAARITEVWFAEQHLKSWNGYLILPI